MNIAQLQNLAVYVRSNGADECGHKSLQISKKHNRHVSLFKRHLFPVGPEARHSESELRASSERLSDLTGQGRFAFGP